MKSEALAIADIVGPWKETEISTGLIERCRDAWNKPISLLSNEELSTLLRQKIALAHLIPIARKRIAEKFEDGTELYEEELENALLDAEIQSRNEKEK
jgi:hypothetical protein